MSRRMDIAKGYEKALVAGDRAAVGKIFHDDIAYWVAGVPPIGGEWRGRERVLDALWNREPGLGAAEWGYEDVWRDWYDAEERVIVEIRERSWLKSAPEDVMDQRTCVVIRFRGDNICEMRDYTDSHIYEEFLTRHQRELPKFAAQFPR
ncbi:MAG TPA: nuclear transport factor 2 family protein [Gemmatimonadales bacterium]|nr:nuclear transport factor 2 family protein [Gemmatimonadales bacterium]